MSEAESIPAFQMAACSKPSDTLCSSENRRCSLMPLTTSGLFFDIDEANCMEWAKAAAGVGWTLLSKPLAWASAESKRLPAKYWIPVEQKYEPVNNVMNQLAQDIPVYITSLNQDRFATARGIRWTVPTSTRDWRELEYARSNVKLRSCERYTSNYAHVHFFDAKPTCLLMRTFGIDCQWNNEQDDNTNQESAAAMRMSQACLRAMLGKNMLLYTCATNRNKVDATTNAGTLHASNYRNRSICDRADGKLHLTNKMQTTVRIPSRIVAIWRHQARCFV